MLTHFYRVTKYDPADRDEHGSYRGPEDTDSDHGEVEAAYLQAVAAFAEDTGIDHLAVREPQVPTHFAAGERVDDFGLDGLFPSGWAAGFHDGAEVPLHIGLELVRAMLRGTGPWCGLEVEDTFTAQVGWDQYLYIGSSRPCAQAVARTRELGLFPEPLDAAPYNFEDDEEGVQRPGDDFWDHLRRAVRDGVAGTLEETYIEGATRWHRLTEDTLSTLRAELAPRARLEVWPPLSPDIETVLGALPAEGIIEGVWQDDTGRLLSALADEEDFPELTARMSRASAAALLPIYTEERVPLFTAVMPDADGVLRARWRTAPTPADRQWALRHSQG
ncbi:RNA-binding protein [Streptomyces sp. cmx-18-6]|uniref:RNA-binding protein n=1 Tax=Streptomyces sp. cmx-18-6 TaxID=2790930 RepID=UPI00398019D4